MTAIEQAAGPAWAGKLSIARSRGDCGDCSWPLCNCTHHDEETSA